MNISIPYAETAHPNNAFRTRILELEQSQATLPETLHTLQKEGMFVKSAIFNMVHQVNMLAASIRGTFLDSPETAAYLDGWLADGLVGDEDERRKLELLQILTTDDPTVVAEPLVDGKFGMQSALNAVRLNRNLTEERMQFFWSGRKVVEDELLLLRNPAFGLKWEVDFEGTLFESDPYYKMSPIPLMSPCLDVAMITAAAQSPDGADLLLRGALRSTFLTENLLYHAVHAYHVAGGNQKDALAENLLIQSSLIKDSQGQVSAMKAYFPSLERVVLRGPKSREGLLNLLHVVCPGDSFDGVADMYLWPILSEAVMTHSAPPFEQFVSNYVAQSRESQQA